VSSIPLQAGIGGALLVTVVATWWPLRAGVKKVEALEL